MPLSSRHLCFAYWHINNRLIRHLALSIRDLGWVTWIGCVRDAFLLCHRFVHVCRFCHVAALRERNSSESFRQKLSNNCRFEATLCVANVNFKIYNQLFHSSGDKANSVAFLICDLISSIWQLSGTCFSHSIHQRDLNKPAANGDKSVPHEHSPAT